MFHVNTCIQTLKWSLKLQNYIRTPGQIQLYLPFAQASCAQESKSLLDKDSDSGPQNTALETILFSGFFQHN